jgi:membrane-associated phospholipid phosphatase
VLAFVYRSFTYLVPLSVVGALVFLDRIRDGYVMLTAAIWVWILGVGAYYLIPSLGPFASAPEDFVHLAPTAITRTQVKYLEERAHLLANPEAGDAFASISAFASLHVGFTCMVMFMLFYFGFRRAAYAMAIYLAGTIVATVYFGWHFVSDDVAGIVLAALAVLLAHLMVYPRGRPPGPAVSTSSTAPTPSRQPADD